MIRLPLSSGTSKMFAVHERTIRIHYLGNRVVFHIPLMNEPIYHIVRTSVESGRMVVEAVERLDKEQRSKIEEPTFYPGESRECPPIMMS